MSDAAESLTLLQDVVTRARRSGADAADAVIIEGESLSISWRMGKLEGLQRSDGADIGLRVFKGRRQAIVSSSDRSPKALEALVERAIAMAAVVPEDPYCGLADPEQLAGSRSLVEAFDQTRPSVEALTAQAAEAEDAARAVPGVTNSEGADTAWECSRSVMVGSNGMARTTERSYSSVSASVLAGRDLGMERDYDYSVAVFREDLDPAAEVGRRAGERAVKRLGGRRVKTAKVPVVFDPRVARGLISHFLGAINGASVARGTTFLKDSLGQSVFAEGLSIVEDPHLKRGLASKAVDAEGLATQRRALIEDGRLTTWLLDLRSARQLGLAPTGHAARGVSSSPSPSSTNVWLEPGAQTPEQLIAEIKEGLYITDLFGQGVNGVTGDYSRGCAGFWIENGTISYPVNEVTVAGNLRDMFRALTPANDLHLHHATEAPTVRIDGLTIAGS